MSHTALAFYRRHQSLTSLDFERPKNLDTVRQVVADRTDQVELQLESLSFEFFKGRKPEEEIREMLPYVHDVMIRNQVSHINSSTLITDAMEKSTDKEEIRDGLPNPVVVLSNYNKKINSFCPGRFESLLQDLDRVLECLQKYCRSFYKGTVKDTYIETAEHYDLKRLEYLEATREQMRDIEQLSKSYKSENGVTKSMFGLAANELARKCDSGSLPFFLVFPECCQKVTSACAIIRKWLQEDSEYVDYIKKDISDLEKKKELQSKLDRDTQQKRVQVNHKLKSLKRDVSDLEDQLEKVKEREASVEQDIKRMEDEIKFTEMDIEAKEGEKEALRKNAGTIFDYAEVNERCERLSSEIAKLKLHIPNVRRMIENVITGKKFIIEKRDLLAKKKEQVLHYGKLADAANQESFREEQELKRIEVCLGQLKEIFLYRTSPDMMKKIFYNMPAEAKRHRLKPMQGPAAGVKLTKAKPKKGSQEEEEEQVSDTTDVPDLMDRAVGIVAQEMNTDWPKLYRRLPFHPARGRTTIEADLDEIIKAKYRATPDTQARASLARWRRMHNRACIKELREVLLDMHRQDVVEKLDALESNAEARGSQPKTLISPMENVNDKEIQKRPMSRIGFGPKYKQVKAAAQQYMILKGPHRHAGRGASLSDPDLLFEADW